MGSRRSVSAGGPDHHVAGFDDDLGVLADAQTEAFGRGDRDHRGDDVAAADVDRFRKFFHGMLAEGVYLAPSAFEAGFVSAAHGDAEIEKTVDAARKVMRQKL